MVKKLNIKGPSKEGQSEYVSNYLVDLFILGVFIWKGIMFVGVTLQ